MNASPHDASGSPQDAGTWVESLGGPLIAVPVSALPGWRGCAREDEEDEDGADDDYDRACAVEGLAGVIGVYGTGGVSGAGGKSPQALVLADEPATTRYLPAHRAFVRWLAADCEADLLARAEAVLSDPGTEWDSCGTWETDGPAVLMDSAVAGSELGVEYSHGGLPEEAPVPIGPGRWAVRAVHLCGEGDTWVGVVRLLPAET